jgi:putative endopeptidase
MRKLTLAAAAALTLVLGAVRAAIDPKQFDPAVKPQDNFFRYVNGPWMKDTPIPAEYSMWGTAMMLVDGNATALRTLCDRAAAKGAAGTAAEKLVGDFYASGMDETAVNAAGAAPLKPEFDRIAALQTPADVLAAIAHLHGLGVGAGFAFGSGADYANSSQEIAQIYQGGLGLPERDYYFRDDEKSKTLRTQYVAHVAKMLELTGDTPAAAQAAAAAVLKLETALADASLTRVVLRNPYARYHKMPVTKLLALTPGLDWNDYFKAAGAPAFTELNVGMPDFCKRFAEQLAQAPVADWQAYLRWHLVHEAARYLSEPFVQENFRFYGTTISGTKELRPRWKRVISSVDAGVGDALGQLYVAEYFPPESKARMLALVANLRAALGERLKTLEWMDEPTRAKALAKLNAFGVKIGYPDKWKDYRTLTIDRGSYVMNALRANGYEVRRDLAKIGQPVDKTEWEMSPPTVNAYYHPLRNEIVFPAGYLQPPIFDPKADDAVNYGAIGATIGHEMTHGFDDRGRQFDLAGNLTDWWTPACDARFKERAARIVKQFSAYTVLDGLHVNGELTEGENIADLGGLRIAYAALEKELAGKPREKIDGFTPEQRFFLGFAMNWRSKWRPEVLRLIVQTDPHSPDEFRVNGPLSNLDEFARAFAVPEGAPMRRPAADRVEIW